LHLWHVSARSRRLYLASSLRTSRRGLSAQCESGTKDALFLEGRGTAEVEVVVTVGSQISLFVLALRTFGFPW